MVKILTDAACRKFVPGPKRRRIRDAAARSLFLVIEPSGHKAWQMRFRRPDGRPGKMTLGPFDRSGRELRRERRFWAPNEDARNDRSWFCERSLRSAYQCEWQGHRQV